MPKKEQDTVAADVNRKKRLADALRENLKRRKAQGKARRSHPAEAAKADEPPAEG